MRSPRSEGLAAPDGTLHSVQQGVVEEQGIPVCLLQAGFVMSAVGYLKKNPNPTREELAHGVSGYLCRCQDYDKILTALGTGRGAFAGGGPVADNTKVGQNYTTPDLVAKVTARQSTLKTSVWTECSRKASAEPSSPCPGQERRHERRRGHAGRARDPQGVGAPGAR